MNNQTKKLIFASSSPLGRGKTTNILNWRRKQTASISNTFAQMNDVSDEMKCLSSWQVQFDDLKTNISLDICLEINDETVFGIDESEKDMVNLSSYFHSILGVSHRHLKILSTETELLVVDLKSTNGTRLNGRSMVSDHPYYVYDGDIIEMGNLKVAINIIRSPGRQTEKIEENARLVRTINHLITLLASNLMPEEKLVRILDVSIKLTHADGIALLLRNEGADTFSLKFERGLGDSRTNLMNVALQENDYLGDALRNGKPVRATRTENHKDNIFSNHIAGAVLYTPLVLGGDSDGILLAIRNDPDNGFEPDDEYALNVIGGLMVIAVREYKNEELSTNAAQNKLEEHTVYRKILQTLLNQNDLRGIYGELRELIRERWKVDNVGLWLVDDFTNNLEPFPKPSFHRSYRLGEELIGTVASRCEPVVANDIKIFSNTKNSPEPTLQLLARSAASVPLMDGDRVFGVLAMFSIKENEFNDEDVKFLGIYSQAAANVIRKTLHFEHVEKEDATILAAVNMLQHPIMIINQEGQLIMSNKAANLMIGELQSTLSSGKSLPNGKTLPSLATFLNELSSSKSNTKEITVGDKVYVATLESAAMVGTIILLQDVTDPVAGVFSNHHYRVLAEQTFVQAMRYRTSLAALVVGFENFNKILEEQGYAIGNRILKELAIRLRGYLRTPDILCRFQDESFVIVLPETELANAKITAQRILHQLKENPIDVGKGRSMSKFAIGVALLDFNNDSSIDDLTKKAGQAFSSARIDKKNNIIIYG